METKKVNILDLANFVVSYFIKNKLEVNHLKIQKVLYYIQSFHLVYFDRFNLFDDQPEAWVNGPVYRAVYDKFKQFGAYTLIGLKSNIDTQDFFTLHRDALKLTEAQWAFMDAILSHYGTMTHDKLVFLTHSELPWNEARKGLGPFDYSNEKISFETMYSFYSSLVEKKNEANA